MKIKYPLKNHIFNRFYVYLLALIAFPIICTYSIYQKTKPKDYERFSIFADIEFKNDGAFKDYLFTELKEDLEIDIYESNRDDTLFNTYFSSYGLNSDICILSKKTLDKFESINFVDLKGTTFDKENNYFFKDSSIGVLYHQKDSSTGNEYINFPIAEDDYYITVNKNGVHLKEITTTGLTDQVYRVINLLIK